MTAGFVYFLPYFPTLVSYDSGKGHILGFQKPTHPKQKLGVGKSMLFPTPSFGFGFCKNGYWVVSHVNRGRGMARLF
jgi:hypothetical protein